MPRRHRFTPEEKSSGGKTGFQKAVASVQARHNLSFSEAVQWVKNRISGKPNKNKEE